MARVLRSASFAALVTALAFVGCSSGSSDNGGAGGSGGDSGGAAGGASGGSSAGSGGSATAGSAAGASGGAVAGASAGAAAGASGGAVAGASGGAAAGASGGAVAGASGGAAAGASGGAAAGMGGGMAGMAGGKTAVANLASTGQAGLTMISGKATFTEMGNQVKVVIDLENCPMGPRAVHMHINKACGDGGNAAGNHWVPNGEGMGNIMCGADSKAHFEFMRAATMWTIGGAAATDITKHALMVHRNGEPSPGDRIACGVIDAQ